MNFFKIKNKIVGNKKVFIIAEIGINHNGDFSECIKLIENAKSSGADAVKLQIINPDESYSKNTKSYKVFKKNLLSFIEINKIKNFAKKKNIILFATPGDFASLKIVKKLKFPAIKISSGLLTNIPLIMESARLNKPIIISTGFAKISEINEAIKTIRKFHNNIAILKCTSIYPAPLKELNLLSIKSLESKFKKNVIGYSDHSLGELACLTAVSLGAKLIEKHFTLNNKQAGADHKISLMPKEFKKMVKKIRNIEDCLGKKNVFPTKYEKKNKRFYHRTVVASSLIKKCEKLNKLNVSIKRSNIKGLRMHPRNYYKILGKTAKKNIKKDELIRFKNIK
jgi:N,N'-diacetyllegionaminate synthase